MRKGQLALLWLVLTSLPVLTGQQATPQELKQAALEVPQLADILQLKPGMTVADVGAGFGATTIVLSKWLGPDGRVYATDIAEVQLRVLREAVARERLSNVRVLEGATAQTNLPDACCDAILVRDVYHHLTRPDEFNRSVLAALKPRGRLAVIDFEPGQDRELPVGVNPNRGGHGIPPSILADEVVSAGMTLEKTLLKWPPEPRLFLVLFRKP